jgi:cation:H+ antiporter
MLTSIISLVSGFLLLIWSADAFTNNSANIAKIFNISPLIIGVIILGFGTSAPEMFVSGLAAFEGYPKMGIGNALGSNIINIALVLGITAIILPIKITLGVVKKREWGYLITVTLISGLLLLDRELDNIDSFVLLTLLAFFLFYTLKKSKTNHHEFDNLITGIDTQQKGTTWFKLIVSLLFLLGSAQLIVFGGSTLATEFGISDLVVGLTIVALGTSLPELAVSISSALKKQTEMVVGNIIGSNLFNTVCVLAIPSLIITPIQVPKDLIIRDYLVMLILTIFLVIFTLTYKSKKERVIGRFKGGVFISIFCIYYYFLF